MREKKSYSVPEIKRMLGMLGVGKTTSYALVKMGCFQTVIVGKHMRILKDSFDNWLASQTHYKLVSDHTGGGKSGINH